MTSMLFGIVRICRVRFKCSYLQNQKVFLIFLCYILDLRQMLNILKKKMIVRAALFRKLQTVKDLVRPLSKKAPFQRTL